MERQHAGRFGTEIRPPWSPLSVTLITLVLPAGGAVVTVLNLRRLRQLDAKRTRQLTIVLLLVFAVGLTVLALLARHGANSTPNLDSSTVTLLSLGVGGASYVAQRPAFRAWRATNGRQATSSWLGAAGMAFLFQLATGAVFGILYVTGGAIHA